MGTVGFEINFRSRQRGPISSGEIHRHVRDYETDVAKALASEAEDVWLRNLHGSIRIQTPFYTTQIDKRRLAWNRWQIHDSDVLYGPWLESGEYTPRTRFPGYFSLERAEAEVDRKRGNIGRKILKRHRARGRLI
jgi:hypothetical protein